MLRVKGADIVDEAGRVVALRGYNVGSWMNMENFLNGFPGVEHRFRSLLRRYAGQEKSDCFFRSFMDNFVAEEDIAYLASIGVNALRVPFNYRQFLKENGGLEFCEAGFERIDWLLNVCKKAHVYMILDFHAAPGHQNCHWHSDNDTMDHFYDKPYYMEKTAEFWGRIADHYKDEEIVAAYELLNEPDARGEEVKALNYVHRRCVEEIRKVDREHIIILNGTDFARDFTGFEEPFDDNLMYSVHCYADAGHMDMAYPGVMNGNIVYDERLLRMQLDQRCEFIRKYNRPCLVGEFGLRGNHPHRAQDRERVLRDQLRYFNECGYSWTVWNHKDVGLRGLLYAAPDSPWMKFTDKIRHLKEVFSTDLAVPITESYMLNRIKKPILECYPDLENSAFSFERTHLDEMLMVHMSDILLAVLCMELSRCSCAELEELNASWKFENVCIRKGWESILRQYLTEGRN